MGSRTVYSTEHRHPCPTCGWPKASCRCSKAAEQDVPDRITAKLRLETSGRRGKAVTVVYDLPQNSAFLKKLGQEVRKLCSTGGAVRPDGIEVQGDHRERLRSHFEAKGWITKG